MLLPKEFLFEREDGKKLVHIALDVLNAVLFPSPYFRRDIIINRNPGFGTNKLGDIEIETRIIDQNHDIGLPSYNVLLALFHVCKDSRQMKQHGNESHVCHFFIMLYHRTTFGCHQIASEKAEFRLPIYVFQSCHQMSRMQIARGLTDNQIVLHQIPAWRQYPRNSSIKPYAVRSTVVGVMAA